MIINLICTFEQCENYEIAIPYPDPAELCICGACNNEITRKEKVELESQPKATKKS